MKHFRMVFGLAFIPIGAFLGSFVSIGKGSGIIIGLVVGIALSCIFLIYGPGHKKNQLLNSYYLKRDQQLNRLNQLDGGRAPWSLREQEASSGEEYENEEHIVSGAQQEDENPLPPPPLRA